MSDEKKYSSGVFAGGLVLMFVIGGMAGNMIGYSDGLEYGQSNIQDQVERNGFIPDSGTELVFAQESIFNRTIGVSFEDKDYSYVCDLRRTTETQISDFALKYEDVDCSVERTDVVEDFDAPGFNNTETMNRVERGNSTE